MSEKNFTMGWQGNLIQIVYIFENQISQIIIFKLSQGTLQFITISGNYITSCFGQSIETLVKVSSFSVPRSFRLVKEAKCSQPLFLQTEQNKLGKCTNNFTQCLSVGTLLYHIAQKGYFGWKIQKKGDSIM